MNPRIPDKNLNDFDSEDFNTVVRRLGEAGWLAEKELNVVNPKELWVHFSQKGQAKMRELHALYKTCDPSWFPLPKTKDASAGLMTFLVRFAEIAPEFARPGLSPSEYNALFAMAANYEHGAK